MVGNNSSSVTLTGDFDTIVDAVRSALGDQGFGVITEIDVQATMAEKLGESYDPYLILGACNPALAHRAMQADQSVATFLPCNVVVRRVGDSTVVEMIDPQMMVSFSDAPELALVADEAAIRLRAALDALR